MEKKNLGIAEAYTVATYLRIGELSVIQYNNGSGSGYPRPDDYYADQMYEKAMDVIQKLGEKKSTGEEETIAADWNSLENVRHTPCYTSFLQRIQAKAR